MTMTNEKAIGLGTKVRTAGALKPPAAYIWNKWIEPAACAGRVAAADGVVIGFEGASQWAPVIVEHAPGTRTLYDRSELTPIPDEKAAPTTPIGRLRATICDVTGASLFIDQWEKIDAALREVEGWIASLQRRADGVAAAQAVVALVPDAMPGARLSALRARVVESAVLSRSEFGEIFDEVDRLRAVEAVRVADVEAVLQRHAVAVGAVGPMPGAKVADPWTGAADRIDRAYEAVRDPDGHEVGPAAWELEAVEEAFKRYVKPARPRVGGWVVVGDTGAANVYDDRGFVVAGVWDRPDGVMGERWAWNALQPFTRPEHGRAPTKEGARAAAVAVLATWADVEGQAPPVPSNP
jgi:hypothetical protein